MPPSPNALELAPSAQRTRLAALRSELERRRDRIAELDETLEEQRACLATFEGRYHGRLAEAEERLARLGGLVGHVERWIRLLGERPPEQVPAQGSRLEARRQAEVRRLQRSRAARAGDGSAEAGADPAAPTRRRAPPRGDPEALKLAYRRLVRRHHPDLAQDEEERLRAVALMQRINRLYREGDLGRLQALAEHAGGAEPLPPDRSPGEQIALLEERLAWFDAVLQNLQDEQDELTGSALHQLWVRAEAAQAEGEDLLAELAQELLARVARRRDDVRWVYHQLEHAVKQYNRREPPAQPPARISGPGANDALVPIFDPVADRPLVRLGLEALEVAALGPAARQSAAWLEAQATEAPALLRLLLFAHVSQLSHLPLPGLETYDALRARFESPPLADGQPPSLEDTLAEGADLVDYGVRRATPTLTYLGLRFRAETVRDAMPLALQAAPVRQAFRQVLQVLGEQILCAGCGRDTFAVPLYRTRGLDDLRATVCPSCGRTQQRYYQPRGDDLQAVLNRAYVDLELVSEWSFRLGRTTVSTQLLPVEADAMTLGDLKARLVEDLFQRYALGVTRRQVTLHQGERRVPERRALAELEDSLLEVRLRPEAGLTLADAVERLRHRIRNRFR